MFGESTRDFLDPDLGVILLLKYISSLDVVLGVLLSGRGVRRERGVVAVFGGVEPATLGVKGVRLECLAAAERVGRIGLCCFSTGIFELEFLGFDVRDAGTCACAFGGTLIIMALLSLACRGERFGGRVGSRRVGVAALESFEL